MMIVRSVIFALGAHIGLLLTSANAQTKRIVTYIEDVQEERKSTRWTLTEWLRIKERMKLMDVWLAMFSNPEEKFAPEISLGYAKSVGETEFQISSLGANDALQSRATNRAEDARLQFWFTNLISGSTGLRTLDVDLGLEGRFRNRFMPGTDTVQVPVGQAWNTQTEKIQQAGVNLRIFGVSSQDSSLVIKGGNFDKDLGFAETDRLSGRYWGGEMSLYLLSFLGAEANYYKYLDGKQTLGTSIDFMGFLELYNLRVGYGQSRHEWEDETETLLMKSKDFDRYLSLRFYF